MLAIPQGAVKRLASVALTAAAGTTIYTAPLSSNGVTIVTGIQLCNISAAGHQVFIVYGTSGLAIFGGETIATLQKQFVSDPNGLMVLNSGETIQAWSDLINVIACTVIGREVT